MTDGSDTLSKRNAWSAFAFRLSGLALICCTLFYYPRYKQPYANATLSWDAAGYYMYLPAAFIYHDIKTLSWGDTVLPEYQPGANTARGFGLVVDNGAVVLQYSSGLAIAEMPFFLIAHALAEPLGFAADGFSRPYQMAIQFGGLLISILGLWLLRRFLLYYYSDKAVAWLLILYALGSNYLNYSAIDGGMSHTWLFTLYAALLLYTRSFYLRPSYKKAIAIGALCGWATLGRPTEIISCLIPLLWGLESVRPAALGQRLRFFWLHAAKLLAAGGVATLICLIQPLYWKYVSGHWLVYSYGTQGFYWSRPYMVEYTFSYRSGWLMYTPLMLFAVVGFIPFLLKGKNRLMALVFSVIAFYIVTAWEIWWYAGTGGRAMIQYYPVLALPFAAMLEWMLQVRWRQWLLVPVLALFFFVNIWFTYQAHRGKLYDAEGFMTKEYYWRVMGRWSAPEHTLRLRDGPYLYESPLPATAKLLGRHSLHGTGSDGIDTLLNVNTPDQHSQEYAVALAPGSGQWVRARAVFHTAVKEGTSWKMPQFILSAWKGAERRQLTLVRPQRFLSDNESAGIDVDLKLDKGSDADSVKVRFWNPGSNERLEMEQLEVWAF